VVAYWLTQGYSIHCSSACGAQYPSHCFIWNLEF